MVPFLSRLFGPKTDPIRLLPHHMPAPAAETVPDVLELIAVPPDRERNFKISAAGGDAGLLSEGWSVPEAFGSLAARAF